MRDCDIGSSALTRRPILKIKGLFVVALPTAIGISIRHRIVERCEAEKQLPSLGAAIERIQVLSVLDRGIHELKKDFEPVNITSVQPDSIPKNDEIFLTDRSGYFLHVLILHDDPKEVLNSGFDGIAEHSDESIEGLVTHIEAIANYATQESSFRHGNTLIVFGGLGRGMMLGFDRWPENWRCHFLPIPDLNLLTRSSGDPLKEFLACMQQKSWIQDRGVELNNINGDLNYFGYWRGNDHKCIPDEQQIDKNVLFSLFTDFVLPVRKELRLSTDRHASKTPDGDYRIVERLTQSSYYQEMREAPVYVSLEDIRYGQLRGVIEKPGINFWLGVDNDKRSIPDPMAYTWWSGLIELCQGAIQLISDNLKGQNARPVQVILSFCDLAPIKDIDTKSDQNRGFETQKVVETHRISLQSNFLANFVQKDNAGERLLLLEIFRCVLTELESQSINTGLTHENIVDSLFSDDGIRLIHAFRAYDEIHRLIFEFASEPRLINRHLFPFMKIRMANQLSLSDTKTDTKAATKPVLNKLVEGYWQEIRGILKTTNKRSLIESCFRQLHRIQVDRVQWNHTAKAVKAIYFKYDDVFRVAQSRDSERNLTSLCLRTIIEMAVCEASDNDGNDATLPLIEDLVILVGLMIEIGSESDAVHSDFSEPTLSIEPSGFFETGTDAYRKIVIPYLSGFFHRQFSEAIESYDELYQEYETSEKDIPEDDDEFNQALQAEIALSEHQIFNMGKSLIRAHLEKELPILVWNKDELLRYLASAGVGESEAIECFIDAFSLPQRAGWDDFSGGHEFKDIAPWKFKRRLSCLCRPMIPVGGNRYLSSAFLLRQGIGYFLDLARDGLFIPSFFSSKAMQSYVGKKTGERGLWFNEVVAQTLTENGFETVRELDMRTFGKPELGDVDVVGIKGDVVTLIECKNLQMAKTVSEIADICNRFRGEEKDELSKHLRRVEWVNLNRDLVSKRLGIDKIEGVKHLLVTNTEIPIKYKEGLPIKREQIISIAELNEALIE